MSTTATAAPSFALALTISIEQPERRRADIPAARFLRRAMHHRRALRRLAVRNVRTPLGRALDALRRHHEQRLADIVGSWLPAMDSTRAFLRAQGGAR